ncbi:MAG: DUF1294 domain-containing protein [Oscillospiraceae bacterium]|nr:DUF1294 domain-containing protein [Oscillospiraceae bacterium]
MLPLSFMYLIIINALGMLLMIVDKSRARKRLSRISEVNLFTIAILGGSFAILFTMILIRHKTRHKKFSIGLPLIIVCQIALLVYKFFA